MSTSIRLTLYGMYYYNSNLFNGLMLPSGMENKIMIDLLLYHYGDLYPYIQVPDKLGNLISVWSTSRLPQWQRAYYALFSSYNPIDNYHMREEVDERPDIQRINHYSDNSSTSGNSDTLRSGYDSSDYVPDSQMISSGSGNNTGSSTISETGNRKTMTERSGNIGVTTTQQMINSEIELRKQNLYDQIMREFENEFMVQLY